jgi:hypothetical protein
MSEFGLFEAMYSARALRRLKPDPVPDEIITQILDAAIPLLRRATRSIGVSSWYGTPRYGVSLVSFTAKAPTSRGSCTERAAVRRI